MFSSPDRVRCAIRCSGLAISTSWSRLMSLALISPGPFLFNVRVASSRACMLIASSFRFSRISVTSSCTPSMVVYSCNTPSISTSVTAQPDMEDSNTRRRALPRVWPNPRFRGSMVIFASVLLIFSTSTRRGFNNSLNVDGICVFPFASYLEYSSTTNCSLISDESSPRSGIVLNTPTIFLASTSTHSGKPI